MKRTKMVIIPLTICILYIVFFAIASALSVQYDWLVSLNEVDCTTFFKKLINDSTTMLALPIVILLVNRKNLAELYIKSTNGGLCMVLLTLYVLFFILHRDYTIRGVYRAFFYLIIVASAEELLFRGYLYGRLKHLDKRLAIVLSGLLFGVGHAILPGVIGNDSVGVIAISMLNYIGDGIVTTYIFVLLMERGGTIYVPILIHALLDYSYKFWGILALIITLTYLIVQKRKLSNKDIDSLDGKKIKYFSRKT